MNLFAVLDQAANRFPDRGALYLGDRRLCTWDELRGRALRLAGSIRQQCGVGARIAIARRLAPDIERFRELSGLPFANWPI